jgi:hypothetical protein
MRVRIYEEQEYRDDTPALFPKFIISVVTFGKKKDVINVWLDGKNQKKNCRAIRNMPTKLNTD